MPRWTIGPGRALLRDGIYQLHIGPADSARRSGLGAADLDAMTHHIAALLNADESRGRPTPVKYRTEGLNG